MTFRLSPAAEADIDMIVRHIAEIDPAIALHWCSEVVANCRMLARNPGLGLELLSFQPGLWMLPVANCLIFYREAPAPGVAEIVRIRHDAHGWQAVF